MIKRKQWGFTLIEVMLVVAMVALLAAAVITSISGQREKARRTAALKTVNSILPYLTDCYMRNKGVVDWDNNTSGGNKNGDPFCEGTTKNIAWPNLSQTGCSYLTYDGAGGSLTIDCDDDSNADITCKAGSTGTCE